MKKYFVLIFCVLTTTAILGQNVQSYLIESWTNGLWVSYSKQNYAYDENGYLIKTYTQLCDTSSNTWKNSIQYIYTNNSDGNVIQYIVQIWDIQLDRWVNNCRVSSTYNSFNKKEIEIVDLWYNDCWNYEIKNTYSYDDDGDTTNVLTQFFQTSSNKWINSYNKNYIYNNGLVQQYIWQNFDQFSCIWLNDQRVSYSYNESNNVQEILIDYIYGNDWFSNVKRLYSYDASGFVSKILTQSKGISTNTWVNSYQRLNSNNSDGVLQQYTDQKWDKSSGSWINFERGTYTYYSKENNEIEFTCFPNPASDFITISLPGSDFVKVSIMNLHGQVLSTRVENSRKFQIPVNDLSQGIYFINVERGGKMGSYKFIKL
ncbi:MAG: T9SS type A sorting domain-containing protein [Bacteroidales bacterium]|nr:T9SS type A sorting domain-containing protein [Bacteroidales bacterium]